MRNETFEQLIKIIKSNEFCKCLVNRRRSCQQLCSNGGRCLLFSGGNGGRYVASLIMLGRALRDVHWFIGLFYLDPPEIGGQAGFYWINL